jgi:hypothetical protein
MIEIHEDPTVAEVLVLLHVRRAKKPLLRPPHLMQRHTSRALIRSNKTRVVQMLEELHGGLDAERRLAYIRADG